MGNDLVSRVYKTICEMEDNNRRFFDAEEVSLWNEKDSYEDVIRALKEIGVPLIELPNYHVPIIMLKNVIEDDISVFLNTGYTGFEDNDIEFLDSNWDTLPRYSISK